MNAMLHSPVREIVNYRLPPRRPRQMQVFRHPRAII